MFTRILSKPLFKRPSTPHFSRSSLNKVCNTIEEALAGLKAGDKILIGGSGICGIPENLLRYIVSQQKYNDLWAVSSSAGKTKQFLR